MKPFRTLTILLLTSTLSGCTFWDMVNGFFMKPHDVVLEDRAMMQWQSLRLAQVATDTGVRIPTDWDAGTFVSVEAFRILGNRLVGARFTNTVSNTVLAVENFELTPDTGLMAASARVGLHIPKYDVTVKADLELAARFVGFEPAKDNEQAMALFRWQPIAIRPLLGDGALTFSSRGAVARAIADMYEMSQDAKSFEMRFPVDDRIALSFGIDETGTIPIKGTGAEVSYKATSAKAKIERRLEFAPPLFGTQGVWLVARIVEDTPHDWNSLLGSRPKADAIATDSARISQIIEARLADRAGDGSIVAFINTSTLTTLFKAIGDLPDDTRKIFAVTTGATGRLADLKWRDDLLGDGGTYAELAEGGAKITAQLGTPSVTANAKGLLMNVDARVNASASIHVHFDPLIGGGMGTVVGLTGEANDTLAISIAPTLLDTPSGKVAALRSSMACRSLPVDIQTDGALKFPGGWASIPKVGVRWQWPIGKQVIPTIGVFDERPTFVSFVPQKLPEHPDWAPGHSDPASSIVLKPIVTEMRHGGMWFAANLTVTSVPVTVATDETLELALNRVRDSIADKAKGIAQVSAEALRTASATQCAAQEEMSVLIDKIEIGKNNDFVKFIGDVFQTAKNAWNVGGSTIEIGKKIADVVLKLDLSKSSELKAEVEKLRENVHKLIDESLAGKYMKGVIDDFDKTLEKNNLHVGIKDGRVEIGPIKIDKPIEKDGDTIKIGPIKIKDPTHGWVCCPI